MIAWVVLACASQAPPDRLEEARRLLDANDLAGARAAYDLVLCRNTVIYFTDDVRDELHARLAETLRPGGYLLVGSTERVSQPMNIGLESTLPFFYRKS